MRVRRHGRGVPALRQEVGAEAASSAIRHGRWARRVFVFQQKLWHVELKAKNTLMLLGLLDLQALVEALHPPTVPFSLSRVA